MRKRYLVIGIVLLLICVSYNSSTALDNVEKSSKSVSDGNTFYVGGYGEGNYTKIQDAIDNASDGDTVFVYHGTYHEVDGLSIRYKSINLVGEDKNITIIANSSIWIYSSKNVIIHGFTIIQEVTYWDINIDFLNCSNCTFYDNIVQSNLSLFRGIYIVGSSEIKIFKNSIEGARISIGIDDSQNCVIQNNYVNGGNCGIQMYHSTNVTVFYNHISKYVVGIDIWFPKNVDVIYNNLVGNIKNVDLVLESKYLFEVFCDGNYWSRPRLLPHIIIGHPMIGNRVRIIPIIQFDWHPAKEPYDIGV